MHKRTKLPRTLRSGVLGERPRCYWCSTEDAPFDVDHLVPVSKGGTNALENLVAACCSCNRRRQDREPWEAYKWLPPGRVDTVLRNAWTSLNAQRRMARAAS